MIATKDYISTLLTERKKWAKVFGIDSSRTVYNPLILLHIKGLKSHTHTILFTSNFNV